MTSCERGWSGPPWRRWPTSAEGRPIRSLSWRRCAGTPAEDRPPARPRDRPTDAAQIVTIAVTAARGGGCASSIGTQRRPRCDDRSCGEVACRRRRRCQPGFQAGTDWHRGLCPGGGETVARGRPRSPLRLLCLAADLPRRARPHRPSRPSPLVAATASPRTLAASSRPLLRPLARGALPRPWADPDRDPRPGLRTL